MSPRVRVVPVLSPRPVRTPRFWGPAKVIRFSLLGSGSSGNAMMVVSPVTKILIDCGLSFKQLQRRLEHSGESLEGLKAVFVTHEHRDHVNGLGTLARRLHAPVLMTRKTYQALPEQVGKLPCVECFEAGENIAFDGLQLMSFSVSHDAADPVSYVVRNGGAQLGMATDLGRVSNVVRARLRGSHALVLESNYCPRMLSCGSYPPAIQQRIRGAQGHLSNDATMNLLSSLLHDALRLVVIVHVSRENNTEDRVRSMAARALERHGAEVMIARQDAPTPFYQIDG